MTINTAIITVLLILFACSLATGQTKSKLQRQPKDFDHQALDLKFEYDTLFDVLENRLPSKSTKSWRDAAPMAGKIHVRIPNGFHIVVLRSEGDWTVPPCEGSPLVDSLCLITNLSSSGTEQARGICLYTTNADFRHLAYHEGFVPKDSTYRVIDIKDEDTSALNWALSHHIWASVGDQGMTLKATYLQTSFWEGLRGSNFAGEAQTTRAFLMRRLNSTCSLVCSYFDSQDEANPFGEIDFYDLVSTIDIRP